jgi:PIN like domain
MNEPRELIFFTDRDLGRQFPALLRAAGVRLERHDDHFGPETPDEEWIGEIGRRGWIAVSRPFNECLCHSFASSLSESARFQAVRTLVRRACVPFESDRVCDLTEIDALPPFVNDRFGEPRLSSAYQSSISAMTLEISEPMFRWIDSYGNPLTFDSVPLSSSRRAAASGSAS